MNVTPRDAADVEADDADHHGVGIEDRLKRGKEDRAVGPPGEEPVDVGHEDQESEAAERDREAAPGSPVNGDGVPEHHGIGGKEEHAVGLANGAQVYGRAGEWARCLRSELPLATRQ
jgi:hypothetical protein